MMEKISWILNSEYWYFHTRVYPTYQWNSEWIFFTKVLCFSGPYMCQRLRMSGASVKPYSCHSLGLLNAPGAALHVLRCLSAPIHGTWIYACVKTPTYTDVCLFVCICMYIYIHTYIYIHINKGTIQKDEILAVDSLKWCIHQWKEWWNNNQSGWPLSDTNRMFYQVAICRKTRGSEDGNRMILWPGKTASERPDFFFFRTRTGHQFFELCVVKQGWSHWQFTCEKSGQSSATWENWLCHMLRRASRCFLGAVLWNRRPDTESVVEVCEASGAVVSV